MENNDLLRKKKKNIGEVNLRDTKGACPEASSERTKGNSIISAPRKSGIEVVDLFDDIEHSDTTK